MTFIFYKELSLSEGFEISALPKHSRLVAGREVSTCSGLELFQSFGRTAIKCWKCRCVADRWISVRHPNDLRAKPVLNLYATRYMKPTKTYPFHRQFLVMMTRDHIIPKSLGGVDLIENLRPGCEICNNARSSRMNKADKLFMQIHPELIDSIRLARANTVRLNEKQRLKITS